MIGDILLRRLRDDQDPDETEESVVRRMRTLADGLTAAQRRTLRGSTTMPGAETLRVLHERGFISTRKPVHTCSGWHVLPTAKGEACRIVLDSEGTD